MAALAPGPKNLKVRTGRKIVQRNGQIMDEMKEDTILVRVHNPDDSDPKTHPYRGILRSNFRVYGLRFRYDETIS